jgi:hypothetical protein
MRAEFLAPYEDEYNYDFELNVFVLGIGVEITPFEEEEEEELCIAEEEDTILSESRRMTASTRFLTNYFSIIEFDSETGEYEKLQ